MQEEEGQWWLLLVNNLVEKKILKKTVKKNIQWHSLHLKQHKEKIKKLRFLLSLSITYWPSGHGAHWPSLMMSYWSERYKKKGEKENESVTKLLAHIIILVMMTVIMVITHFLCQCWYLQHFLYKLQPILLLQHSPWGTSISHSLKQLYFEPQSN